MDIDRQKQQEIIDNTNKLLQKKESKRSLLRFQKGVVDLENNQFTVLQNREFVDKLIDYLYTLHKKGNTANTLKIIEKIGISACSLEQEYRERAVFILSVFTEKISQDKNNPEYLETVSRLFVNWLKIETEYISGFEFVCRQLQMILQRMLATGLWYQAENLIIALSQIQSGVITKSKLIRRTIIKLHSSLADEAFLRKLVEVYLDRQEDRRDIAQSLLTHLGTKASAFLVQSLVQSQDREKRFALLELIPSVGRSIIPILDRCLEQNPPWYVIRNIIIIISRLDDPDLYSMVRPYLVHKDMRVQQQVLNCINRMGSSLIRERMIEALGYINDELKQQVVIQLGNIGGKDVGEAFCALLEKRAGFTKFIEEDLTIALCTKIKFLPSQRAIQAVKAVIAERLQYHDDGDRVLLAAQDALVSLELKDSESRTPSLLPPRVTTRKELPDDEGEILSFDGLTDEDIADAAALTSRISDREGAAGPIARNSDREAASEIRPANPVEAAHFNLWADLYEQMSTHEFSSFHEALNHRTYQPEETIVAAGDIQAPLFFFDRGTVTLSRQNREGEESYFSPIGAGEMIGSDVFLSGDAWNLSLTANEEVTAHIFDLENLLRLQIDHPQLAEKIFAYCEQYDVLPSLLRVLDEPDEEAGETVNLHRDGIDGIADQPPAERREWSSTVLKKLAGGLCFSLPVKAGEHIAHLPGNQVRLGIRLSSGAIRSVTATIIGVVRTLLYPGQAIVSVRFVQPFGSASYCCENIEFSEST